MEFRQYDAERDRAAVLRIWQETGWVPAGKESTLDVSLGAGRTLVAEVNGAAECMVNTVPGRLRYLEQELAFSAVTAVATSRPARKQGLAKRLTALAVAADAAEGALVAGLGMFEQGFYNQLGFGTGGYEHRVAFDPSQLNVRVRARLPRRITADDWAVAHAARLARARGHGSLNLLPPECTHVEMLRMDNGFGLGYDDGPHGELTHYFWGGTRAVERGPYYIAWTAFQTREHFLELMALVKSLGDQVRLVRLNEPQGIQMQDLLLYPFRHRVQTRGSEYESGVRAVAYWQMRICDLAGCLARTHLRGGPVRFNLCLTDPIAPLLDEGWLERRGYTWRGVEGDYVVTLGAESSAEAGSDPSRPTLTASVGAFTRMWLGVRPAGGLAITDELSGPAELLRELDQVLCLPDPRPGWDF